MTEFVLSLYDYTGEALKPWAKAGYACIAFDILHTGKEIETFEGGGYIHFKHADLHNAKTLYNILETYQGTNVAFGMAFPVCTDLAVSGAAHFAKKRAKDPEFQNKAAGHAVAAEYLFEMLQIPYFIENPVSVLSSLWRKPDYSFHPFEYGGYIADSEKDHPRWPEYIPAQDAYKKKTCLWTGGGFVMPDRRPVDCSAYFGNGYSKPMMKLGGKSQRTKNIRSATPRGFAQAIYQANRSTAQAHKQAAE
jgi:hypothetical protein